MKIFLFLLFSLSQAIAMDANIEALSVAELRKLRDHTSDILLRKELFQIEQYTNDLNRGTPVDSLNAMELAQNAWLDTSCSIHRVKIVNYLVMLVYKNIALECALKIAQEIQHDNLTAAILGECGQTELINASLWLLLALVEQNHEPAYEEARSAVINWKSSYDFKTCKDTNSAFQESVSLLTSALQKRGITKLSLFETFTR